MIWSAADLRALEGIRVGHSEVVYAFLSLEGEPSALDEALLDDEERRRSRRFVHPRDRRRFVRAHADLRLFLALCLEVEPATVRYETGVHGKPRLLPGLPPLEFNLSHSEGLGLLAVARDRSVGVDVEHVRDLPDAMSIADTHFTAAESKALRSLPPPERRAAFFRYWARKEAVIKAGGEGLGRALDSFDVDGSAGLDVGGDAMGRRIPWRHGMVLARPAVAGRLCGRRCGCGSRGCPRAVAGALDRGSGRTRLCHKKPPLSP